MATDPQTLTIEAGQWGPEAEHWLGQTGTQADLIDYRDQHDNGAALFYVKHAGRTVGAFLLRVDRYASGTDGVIVAAAAGLEGFDVMASCMPSIEKRFVGVDRIRYHTGHPAVARKMARHGYTPAEIVCIKELNHGQQIQ